MAINPSLKTVGLCTCLFCTAYSKPVWGQIQSDASVSTHVMPLGADQVRITGGQQVGSNLFHSFAQFSIPTHGSAHFDNPQAVTHIISRVTGHSPSVIDGQLRANHSANLFLINPRGLQFGPNARLALGGSFIASTAETLNFADGFTYRAVDPEPAPLLTLTAPSNLTFGANPAPISVQTRPTARGLTVPASHALALIGGDITLDRANLNAPGGRIELGSVGAQGIVDVIATNGSFDFTYRRVPRRQNITLHNQSVLNVIGPTPGNIDLTGKTITISDSNLTLTTLEAEENQTPQNSPARIQIEASQNLSVSGDSQILTRSFNPDIAGGDIVINTQQLESQDEAEITTRAIIGMGGDIEINAQQIDLTDNTLIRAFANMTTGGDILIRTQTLNLEGDSRVSAPAGSGNSGTLIVEAQESIQIVGRTSEIASRASRGEGGTLSLKTGNLTLLEGGKVSTTAFGSRGNAGTVNIDVADTILVKGGSSDGQFSSAIFSQSIGGGATGNAGNVTITAKRLLVEEGAEVSVRAGPANFEPLAPGSSLGNAGELNISASELVQVTGSRVDASGIVRPSTLTARADGPGSAGDLVVQTQQLNISDGAEVNVRSLVAGEAGNVVVQADNIALDNQGKIIAETESGAGGSIDLTVRDLLSLRRQSVISTSGGLEGGTGDGGNVNIVADVLVAPAVENSDITTDAFSGNGGTINITAQGIFGPQFRAARTDRSDITANSQFGVDGTVNLEVPDVDPSDSLNPLPENPVVVKPLDRRCAPTAEPTAGRFVHTSKGGVANYPSRPSLQATNLRQLASPVPSAAQVGLPTQAQTSTTTPQPIAREAQGWRQNARGEIYLVAQAQFLPPAYHPGACQAISDKRMG